MESKKSPKAELTKNSKFYFAIGLCHRPLPCAFSVLETPGMENLRQICHTHWRS